MMQCIEMFLQDMFHIIQCIVLQIIGFGFSLMFAQDAMYRDVYNRIMCHIIDVCTR